MITSAQNPKIKHLAKLVKEAAYRAACGSVVVEGRKLVRELCQNTPAKTLIVTDEKLAEAPCEERLVVSGALFKKISGTKTPEGVAAELPMPQEASLRGCRRLIVLEGVADPGNLGALLRSALAFGWEGLFLLEGCCDLYNDKALRAARGATFRLPARRGGWEELKRLVKENRLPLYAADLRGEGPEEVAKNGIALLFGNEARGVSPEAREACRRVALPMREGVESLNVAVAGGILMYLLGKR